MGCSSSKATESAEVRSIQSPRATHKAAQEEEVAPLKGSEKQSREIVDSVSVQKEKVQAEKQVMTLVENPVLPQDEPAVTSSPSSDDVTEDLIASVKERIQKEKTHLEQDPAAHREAEPVQESEPLVGKNTMISDEPSEEDEGPVIIPPVEEAKVVNKEVPATDNVPFVSTELEEEKPEQPAEKPNEEDPLEYEAPSGQGEPIIVPPFAESSIKEEASEPAEMEALPEEPKLTEGSGKEEKAPEAGLSKEEEPTLEEQEEVQEDSVPEESIKNEEEQVLLDTEALTNEPEIERGLESEERATTRRSQADSDKAGLVAKDNTPPPQDDASPEEPVEGQDAPVILPPVSDLKKRQEKSVVADAAVETEEQEVVDVDDAPGEKSPTDSVLDIAPTEQEDVTMVDTDNAEPAVKDVVSGVVDASNEKEHAPAFGKEKADDERKVAEIETSTTKSEPALYPAVQDFVLGKDSAMKEEAATAEAAHEDVAAECNVAEENEKTTPILKEPSLKAGQEEQSGETPVKEAVTADKEESTEEVTMVEESSESDAKEDIRSPPSLVKAPDPRAAFSNKSKVERASIAALRSKGGVHKNKKLFDSKVPPAQKVDASGNAISGTIAQFGGSEKVTAIQRRKQELEKKEKDNKEAADPKSQLKTSWNTAGRPGAYKKKVQHKKGPRSKKNLADLP